MAWTDYRIAPLALVLVLIVGCTGNPDGALARERSSGLATAYDELNSAEAEGFSGTIDWTKAASLLTAAKVQYEFEHYPNCIDKVERARGYIQRAKGSQQAEPGLSLSHARGVQMEPRTTKTMKALSNPKIQFETPTGYRKIALHPAR